MMYMKNWLISDSAYNLSRDELQRAVDSIHAAAYGGESGGTFKNFGGSNPITVTVTPSGQVILSKNNTRPTDAAISKAYEIFGKDNVAVVERRGKNYDTKGLNLSNGGLANHSEVRGIQETKNLYGSAQDSIQAYLRNKLNNGVLNPAEQEVTNKLNIDT